MSEAICSKTSLSTHLGPARSLLGIWHAFPHSPFAQETKNHVIQTIVGFFYFVTDGGLPFLPFSLHNPRPPALNAPPACSI
jgi:hypothetical protein